MPDWTTEVDKPEVEELSPLDERFIRMGKARKPSVVAADGWRSLMVAELQRLNGQLHDRKKKDTIIALLDARLAGLSEESVWKRGETCARSTWHEKWKKKPLIAEVLANCWAMADDWRDNRVTLALAETADRLGLESPASLDTVIDVRDFAEADRDRLTAAFGIMDRASSLIAPKSESKTEHSVNADQFAMLQMDAENEAEAIDDEAEAGWSPDAGAPDDPGDQVQ